MFSGLKIYSKSVDLVVDVGVAYGTPDLYKAFRKTRKILVEPLSDYVEHLRLDKSIENAIIIQGCASDSKKNISFFVRDSKSTSSLNQGIDYSEKLNISTEKLDILCKGLFEHSQSICLKIDTEGSELKVLRGADEILAKCIVVVAESTFYPTLKGANDFFELVDYMKTKNFKIVDIVNVRKSNGELDQCDVIFVNQNQTKTL